MGFGYFPGKPLVLTGTVRTIIAAWTTRDISCRVFKVLFQIFMVASCWEDHKVQNLKQLHFFTGANGLFRLTLRANPKRKKSPQVELGAVTVTAVEGILETIDSPHLLE